MRHQPDQIGLARDPQGIREARHHGGDLAGEAESFQRMVDRSGELLPSGHDDMPGGGDRGGDELSGKQGNEAFIGADRKGPLQGAEIEGVLLRAENVPHLSRQQMNPLAQRVGAVTLPSA